MKCLRSGRRHLGLMAVGMLAACAATALAEEAKSGRLMVVVQPTTRPAEAPSTTPINTNGPATDVPEANTNGAVGDDDGNTNGMNEAPADAAESAVDSLSGAAAAAVRMLSNPGARKATPADEPEIKPRLELYIPSVRTLLAEARRSRSGLFVSYLGELMQELSSDRAEGMGMDDAQALVGQFQDWPDTAVDAATFAPDREGRARWAMQVALPADALYARLKSLLSAEAVRDVLAGVEVIADERGGYVLRVPRATLAYVLPTEGGALVASHRDLVLASSPYRGTEATEVGGPALLACRLNLTNTERDSGQTFFSQFSVVTAIDYACRVNAAGEWVDSLRVYWPPVSGMAIKAMFGRVKHTFFVPENAFGGVVFDSMMAPAMLEQMVGLGQQVVMTAPGELDVIGDATGGPVAAHVRSEACVTVLPGDGFLPAPDVVVQARVKHAEDFIKGLRAATEARNAEYRAREQRAPWHEATVRTRSVFWSEGGETGGVMLPLVMRPVIFVTQETDAEGRQREYAVIGWTSTGPENLVRRWLDLPRPIERRYLPTEAKTNGQAWINWGQVYDWASPYLNIGLSAVSAEVLLPGTAEARAHLSDGMLSMRVMYEGLDVAHQGPIPLGVAAVPAMYAASTMADRSGGSDLARERLACERLQVLYHHSRLFREDIGRWPAEVAELDGYVDFAGHPYLLRLQRSARQERGLWMLDFFGDSQTADDAAESEDDADGQATIDDGLYVIEWGRDAWTLGLKPGTLEHLEKLYIDQDGVIHRVENEDGGVDGAAAPANAEATPTPVE